MPMQLVRYDLEYDSIGGLYKQRNPKPLHHNLHVVDLAREQLFLPQPVDRDIYRLIQLSIGIVNVGATVELLPNVFALPTYYSIPKQGQQRWLVGTKFAQMFLRGPLVGGVLPDVPELERQSSFVQMGWDGVPGKPENKDPRIDFYWAGLSPSYGCSGLDFASDLDITDVPNGDYMFTLLVTNGITVLDRIDQPVHLEVTDIRLIV